MAHFLGTFPSDAGAFAHRDVLHGRDFAFFLCAEAAVCPANCNSNFNLGVRIFNNLRSHGLVAGTIRRIRSRDIANSPVAWGEHLHAIGRFNLRHARWHVYSNN